MENLKKYGFMDDFIKGVDIPEKWVVGRVISQYNHLYRVITEDRELIGEVSGKYKFEIIEETDFPTIGDFVLIETQDDERGVIHERLKRKSSFIRKAAGTVKSSSQVVAANIDTLFICMSLNKDFNIRRLERYLAISWESRAKPVIVLTKSDLCPDIRQRIQQVEEIAFGVPLFATSCFDEKLHEKLRVHIMSGETAAFIGSSGVGKSTLINCLAGKEVFATGGLQEDDKSRHTTTNRELILLDQGIMVIDTPGMREIGIVSSDLEKTFSDIEQLAQSCKFGDCSHEKEPACAVRQAIENGDLEEARLTSYRKLERETHYRDQNAKIREKKKLDSILKDIGGTKNMKKFQKEKRRQKGR